MEQNTTKQHWAFVGMSRAGKSHSSLRLQAIGFQKVECDVLIRQKMEQKVPLAFPTGESMGNWLGLPTAEGFAERERLHIEAENEVMQDLLQALNSQPERYIIDTSGSVVYCCPNILQALKECCKIIYFEVAQEAYDSMLKQYLACPLPLIWNGAFTGKFESSYTYLINTRAQLYQELADVILPYHLHRNPNLSTENLYETILNLLR